MDQKTTIPNPLGARLVATSPEDCSGWQITQHHPSATVSADVFMASNEAAYRVWRDGSALPHDRKLIAWREAADAR